MSADEHAAEKPIRLPVRRKEGCEDLPLPRYMSAGASGMDLCAAVEQDLLDARLPEDAHRLLGEGDVLVEDVHAAGQFLEPVYSRSSGLAGLVVKVRESRTGVNALSDDDNETYAGGSSVGLPSEKS